MFDSNIHARKKEFHVYNTSDIALEAIGMCSYTQSSISGYLSRQTDDELKKYFNDVPLDIIKNKLTGQIDSPFTEEPAIFRFNKETKEYDLVTGARIFETFDGTSVATTMNELLEKHNKVQYGSLDDDNVVEVIKNVQTSLSGCITFRPYFVVLGCPREPQIKLYFKNRFNNDTNRTIAQRGSPFIVDIARRTTGQAHGQRGTENSPEGVYANQSEGGIDNPNNTIAAPMDIRYNSAMGKWQGGTHQILVRLLTDIDPAPFNLSDFDSLNTADTSFYDPNSSNYISQFTTGLGLPLSVENGNPHKFGPNIIGCVDSEGNLSNAKTEKILIVNRSARNFKKGDVVLCSHIDNEWIPMGFDAGSLSKPRGKIGKWQFQKFIALDSNFFKGYIKGNSELPTNPDIIESKIRTRYYLDMISDAGDNSSPYSSSSQHLDSLINDLTRIAKLNLYVSSNPLTDEILDDITKLDKWENDALSAPLPVYDNFYPYQCSQMTIFDQLSSTMGGTNSFGTVIGRTVPDELTRDAAIGTSYQSSLPTFWGPAFPDGYSSQQVSSLKQATFNKYNNPKTTPSGLPWIITDSNGNETLPQVSTSKEYLGGNAINIFSSDTRIANKALNMFATTTDGNAKQLPAEIALNGCLQTSTYGYPIEHIYVPEDVNSIDFYSQHLSGYNIADTGRGGYTRYNYLLNVESATNNGKTDLTYKDIALSPLQPNKIQFSPLQLEFALSSFVSGSDEFSEILSNINTFKNLYDAPPGPLDLFGGFIERNKDLIPGGTRQRNFVEGNFGRIPFYNLGDSYKDVSPNGPTQYANNLLSPIGSPFNKIKFSDVIGIVASKNKFSISANGSLTFKTSQYFGLSPKVTIVGGQGPQVTILGAFLGWTDSSNPLAQNSVEQWGDLTKTDNYDSTGTTALHVRIFDQWPDVQTIYLGHCFSVLHFNPIVPYNRGGQSEGEYIQYRTNGVKQILKDKGEAGQRWVDAIESSVDFKVPTYKTGGYISLGTTFSYTTKEDYNSGINLIRPFSEWNINPIRRYALLTKGGFAYYRNVIGIDSANLFTGGSGYTKGDILTGTNNTKFEVTEVDGGTGAIVTFEILDRGFGFVPSDFTQYKDENDVIYYAIRSSVSGGSGRNAKIDISRLIVYSKLYYDPAPTQRSSIIRLTLPSYDGKKISEGSLETTVSLEGGTGKYDAFYFFHNDILHTLTNSTAFTAGFAQYVNLEIGAG